MRPWTINGDFASLKPTGVARYGDRVVRALDGLLAEHHRDLADLELRLLVKAGAPHVPALSALPIEEAADIKPHLPQVWTQVILPRRVKGGLVSFCNYGPLATRRQILCIHDIHPLTAPESYTWGFRTYNRAMLPLLGRRLAAITTVSRFSAQDIAAHRIAPADKIIVTYNGHEHVHETADIVLPPSPRPFVMGIGRDLAYKNTEMFFRIAPALDEAGLDLVLAGAFDPAAYLPAGAPLPANIELAGRVSDATLFALMRRARAFLFPSRVEGFGLPAVEAMAADCPLVVADAPALPEIVGDAAIVVDPDDVEGWARAAIRLGNDAQARETLLARGRERRKAFSWRAIALQYIHAMHTIDGVRPAPAVPMEAVG